MQNLFRYMATIFLHLRSLTHTCASLLLSLFLEAKIPAAYEHSNENIQKSQPFLPRGHRNRPR